MKERVAAWQHRLSFVAVAERERGSRILAWMAGRWVTAEWFPEHKLWIGDGMGLSLSRDNQPTFFRRLPPAVDEEAIQRSVYMRR